MVFGINRVEPRESNSRPVFGRVLFLTQRTRGTQSFLVFCDSEKEIAMTDENTITRQRLGGL